MSPVLEDQNYQQMDQNEDDDVDFKDGGVGVEISYHEGTNSEELVWI